MPGSFLDTNVLLYLASSDEAKAERAERLVKDGGVVSVQVLNEAANVARRKMGMSWDETRLLLSTLRVSLTVEPLTSETHELGLDLAQRYGFSVWDSMIVAAAVRAGCERLWSEDMQPGLRVDGALTISNPFR